MNYALIFNNLLESICVNLLDYLKLYPDFLPSSLHRENRPLPDKEDKPLLYRKSLIKADVDVLRVRSDRVQLAISLITFFIAPLVAFLCKASLALPLPDKKDADL